MAITKALKLWYDVEKFLKIRTVPEAEVEGLSNRIDQFKQNFKLFYECDASLFLINKDVGSKEAFICIPYIIIYQI